MFYQLVRRLHGVVMTTTRLRPSTKPGFYLCFSHFTQGGVPILSSLARMGRNTNKISPVIRFTEGLDGIAAPGVNHDAGKTMSKGPGIHMSDACPRWIAKLPMWAARDGAHAFAPFAKGQAGLERERQVDA